MARTGYTPGPWRIERETQIGADWKYTGGNPIARVDMIHRNIARPEMEANARLIAAAPELLEACEEALATLQAWKWLEHAGPEGDPRAKLRAAIAKAIAQARGEEVGG